jgi:multicomponent Na+:H+ antiporter subunit G
MSAWIADILVVFGVVIMTLGVVGVVRMPDVYAKLHAASKAVFLGVIVLCGATFVTGDPAIIARATLIAIVLLLTTPVASHAIGRGAFLDNEHMSSADAIDESGHHLEPEEPVWRI